MVVGPKKIYYEQSGKVKVSDITFTNDRQVLNVIERIVSKVGRRIDEKTPYVDARLQDGSRVHAIIRPVALDGGTITIRKFPEERLTYKSLVDYGSLTQNMADFLKISVTNHRNIVISGGTGSGKTTLINILGSFIPANERIITCEDSAELNLPQEHVVRLETKPPSLEGDPSHLYHPPAIHTHSSAGINKLTVKLRDPTYEENQELLNFLSRVPSDIELVRLLI